MFNVRFDGSKGSVFPNNEQASTIWACQQVDAFSTLAVQFPAAAMILWFGAGADQDATLKDNLKRMNTVIKDNMRTVTFVEATGVDLRVSYNPENALQPPVHHDVLKEPVFNRPDPSPPKPPGPDAGQFYGFAFPTNATMPYETKGVTSGHVGSGMRIYLGTNYFSTGQNSLERPQTIYHEMSHKVLATNDHEYGAAECQQLALNNAAKARKNADNYGYFVTSLGGYVWP